MSTIRKDQPRPQADAEALAETQGQAGNDTTGAIDKGTVMKSFYQRALEERDGEIERLRQDNQRLRAKIIAGDGLPADDSEADVDDAGHENSDDYATLKPSADISAQIVTSLMADKEKIAVELMESKDRQLRTLAELENVRRRAEREKQDIAKYAISEFARDVIGIGDTMQRAIDHVPAEAAAGDSALKSFLEGVQLMERELLATLERHGVVRANPSGEKFDPNKHQAVMEQDDPSVAPGTIVQVLQSGFMIGERTLRPAIVAVARGGAKAPKVAEAVAEVAAADPVPELPDGAQDEAEPPKPGTAE